MRITYTLVRVLVLLIVAQHAQTCWAQFNFVETTTPRAALDIARETPVPTPTPSRGNYFSQMLYDRVLRALQESHQTVEMVDQIGQTLEKTGAEVAEDIRSYCRPNVGAPDAPRWVASRDAQGQKEVFLICSHSKESLEEARIYMALFEKDRLTNLEILEIPQQRLLEIIAKNSTAQLNSNIHSLNPNIGYFAEPQLKFSGWSGIKLTANDAFLAGTFAATLAGLYKQNQDSRAQDANNPDVKTSTIGRILGSMVLRRRADIRTTF